MIDYDYIYFFLFPIGFSIALAVLRKRTLQLKLVLLGLLLVVSTLLYLTRMPANESKTWVGVALFICLPLSFIAGFSRLQVFSQKPFLLLLMGPVIFFVSYVLAVNIWLLLGFSK